MKRMRPVLFALCACAFLPLSAQVSELPEGLDPEAAFLARLSGLFSAEDPASIYNFDVYDEEVEFILDGSWETRLDGALTVSFDAGSPVIATAPPVFSQTVDLSSWVFINQTWYFESNFAEQFTKNTVAAGYVGSDDTPVKHVRLGNSQIVFPGTYPFVRVGGGTAIAPGVMGTFAGDSWNADAIVRYDTAASRLMVLSGMNEVTDTLVPLSSLTGGKWFVLPDAPVTGSVSVYVTDDAGPVRDSGGRRWRELNQAEFRVYGIEGTVELAQETNESVAVVYDGGYASAGATDPSLMTFMSEARTFFDDIDGVDEPVDTDDSLVKSYLPANIENDYLLSLSGKPALLLRERGYFSPFADLSHYRAEGTDLVAVFAESGVKSQSLAAAESDGTWTRLYRTQEPIAPAGIDGSRSPEARFPLAPDFPYLYLPSFGGKKPDTDLSIRSRSYKPVTSLSLGSEAIAGTIQVTRDGIADPAFRFDENTGILSLEKQPGSAETIRITWLDTDPSTRNATLTIAGGARWSPTESLSVTAASAFRWNVSKDGYTDYADSSPGSFILSSGLSWTGTNLSAATAFAYDISVSDTTGFYRILGMESTPKTFYPDADWYEPTPADIVPVLGAPFDDAATITLDKTNRVSLDGTDGDRLRTVSDTSLSGAVLAMSCNLPSLGSWASAEILTGTKGSADFRAAKRVEIALKNTGTTAGFEIYVQLGTGASDSYEDRNTVRTWKIKDTPAADSKWIVPPPLELSDEDRAALGAGGNMRIVLYSPADGTGEVSLYTGPVEITETSFAAGASPALADSTKLSVQEVREVTTPLAAAEPEIVQKFNAGGINTVLKIEFTPEPATQTITVSKNIPALPLSQYHYLSFFIKREGVLPGAGKNMTVSFTRPDESGTGTNPALVLTLPADSLTAGDWQKITVDLRKRTVSKSGATIPAASVAVDRTVKPTRVAFAFDDWPIDITEWPAKQTYTIYLDELYLEESESEYTVRNESSVAWKKTGAVFSAGRTAILSDASLAVTTLSSAGTSSPDPVVSGTAQTGFTLLKAKAEGALTATTASTRAVDSTTHSLSVPVGPLSAGERFAADFTGNTFRHENSLSLSGPIALGATVGVRFTGRNLERKADFRLAPALPDTPIGTFTLGADSAFFQTGLSPIQAAADSQWSDLWTDSLGWSLSTGETDATKRTGKTALRAGWTVPKTENPRSGLSGISVDAEALSDYQGTGASALGSTLSYTLALPFRVGLATLTPSWQRTAGQNGLIPAGGTFVSDTAFVGSSLAAQDWLYRIPPFTDLIEPDLEQTIRDDGVYSRTFANRYGISWKRPSPGRLSDLWLPASLDTSIKRDTATDAKAANVQDGYTATAKAGFSALNIAGTFGILRVFPWYEQDEIAQLYGWTSKWGAGYFTWSADTWHSVMLFFPGGGTLVAENAWHYDSPSIAGTGELARDTIRLVWKRSGKPSFMEPLVRRWTKAALSTKREDSASVSVTRTDTTATAFTYDHVVKTGIGTNGEIQLTGGTGYAKSGENAAAIQLRFGIGGKLTY